MGVGVLETGVLETGVLATGAGVMGAVATGVGATGAAGLAGAGVGARCWCGRRHRLGGGRRFWRRGRSARLHLGDYGSDRHRLASGDQNFDDLAC